LTGKLSPEQLEYLSHARVARLATTNKKNSIQIVPVVFASAGDRIYFVMDRKTKRKGKEPRRIKNITETGKASLLVDKYSENWEDLFFLLLDCKAKVIGRGVEIKEKKLAAAKLKQKYPQYRDGGYFPENLDQTIFVRLQPQKAVFWRNLRKSLV